MPWRVEELYAGVAKLDHVAVNGDDVASGDRHVKTRGVGFALDQLPVFLGHYNFCAVLLKELAAAGLIKVAVGVDHVLDVARIEPDAAEVVFEHARPLAVERVDQNDAFTRGDRVGRHPVDANVVNVVEDFERLNVLLFVVLPFIPEGLEHRWTTSRV